jgi:hypothetical protein
MRAVGEADAKSVKRGYDSFFFTRQIVTDLMRLGLEEIPATVSMASVRMPSNESDWEEDGLDPGRELLEFNPQKPLPDPNKIPLAKLDMMIGPENRKRLYRLNIWTGKLSHREQVKLWNKEKNGEAHFDNDLDQEKDLGHVFGWELETEQENQKPSTDAAIRKRIEKDPVFKSWKAKMSQYNRVLSMSALSPSSSESMGFSEIYKPNELGFLEIDLHAGKIVRLVPSSPDKRIVERLVRREYIRLVNEEEDALVSTYRKYQIDQPFWLWQLNQMRPIIRKRLEDHPDIMKRGKKLTYGEVDRALSRLAKRDAYQECIRQRARVDTPFMSTTEREREDRLRGLRDRYNKGARR